MRRDREEVLRKAVVNLARHACALVGDGAAELCKLDRTPRADQEDDEREHAQEVPLRDERARQERLEDEVQRREEHERETERKPAREVVAAAHEAHSPADDCDERHERLERERARQVERLLLVSPGSAPAARGRVRAEATTRRRA